MNSLLASKACDITGAHRAKMLDDHATDSNHKKMLSIVSTLWKSHWTAIDMVKSAQLYYDNLIIQAGPMAVAKWSSDIEATERNCIYDLEAMDIYAAKLNEHQLAIRPPTNMASSPALEQWMALALL